MHGLCCSLQSEAEGEAARERLVSFTAAPPLYRLDARHCTLSLGLDARMLVINLGLDSAPHGYERMYKYV